jgi:hypothetical protein
MNFKALALITITAAAIAAPAFAHHSFAMFDSDKTVTLNGTVKEFEWTNPHSWIRINVADANGIERQWAIEMGSPAQIAGRGWKSDTIKRRQDRSDDPSSEGWVSRRPVHVGALPDGRRRERRPVQRAGQLALAPSQF